MRALLIWLRDHLSPVRTARRQYNATRDPVVRSLEAKRIRSVRRERRVASIHDRITGTPRGEARHGSS